MKNIFKKNQMIITALAIMIAVAGYLNYSGSKLDSASITAGSGQPQKRMTITLQQIFPQRICMPRPGLRNCSLRTAILQAWIRMHRIWIRLNWEKMRIQERPYWQAPHRG